MQHNCLRPSLSPSGCLSGVRNSECFVALLTERGAKSADVGQEIGLARGIDLLIIPLLEEGATCLFSLSACCPSRSPGMAGSDDCIGLLIKIIRDLCRLEWLKVACPKCGGDDAVSYAAVWSIPPCKGLLLDGSWLPCDKISGSGPLRPGKEEA